MCDNARLFLWVAVEALDFSSAEKMSHRSYRVHLVRYCGPFARVLVVLLALATCAAILWAGVARTDIILKHR